MAVTQIAAHRGRTVGFGVESFLLGMDSVQVQRDDSLGPAKRGPAARRASLLGEQSWERKSQAAQAANPQHFSP